MKNTILILIIFLTTLFGLVKSCESDNLKKKNLELEQKINNGHFEQYVVKHDTVREIINLNYSIKETHQQEVNSLKYRLKIAKQDKDTITIIEVQEKTILQQDTVIKYLEKNDTLQKDLLAKQDSTITDLNNSNEALKVEKKELRKKKRKAAIIATISTATAIFTTIKAIDK